MQLVLFLVSYVAVATAVDRCHSDRDKDHRPRENCTSAGFGDVPEGFELKTKVLLFPRNRFTSLSWSSFQIFTEIYEIDLTGNQVSEVTPSLGPILPSLSVLRLGSNLLTSLSDGSFSACPALTELYLDNNLISSLRDHTFTGLSKLEILDLSSNHISVLPRVMLHPLPALETLYLESNKIKVMPDDWFMKKEEVPYLYLSINPWTCNCSLKYLHKYLNDYEFNVYVRDGPIINSDAESVVCESPQLHQGKAVMSLDESDLCLKETPDSDVAASHVVTAVYREVRTWSWYQTFTLMEAAHHSGSLSRGDGSRSLNAPLMDSITSITERPGTTMIIPPEPATSKSTAPTAEPRPWETTQITTKTTTIPSKTTTIPTKTTTTPSKTTTIPTKTTTTPSKTTTIPTTTTPSKTTTTKGIATMAPTVATKITTTSSKATTTSSPSLGGGVTAADRWARTRAHRAAAAFCFWLFVVCLLLCITSAACVAVTGVWLWMWYRRVYRPRSEVQARKGVGGERVELLTLNKEEKEATGGVKALYRSVLYVHREEEAAEEKEAEGEEEAAEEKEAEGEEEAAEEKEAEGGKERVLVNLQPTAAEGATRGGGRETRVYRKTLYRLISKEEAIEAWRVMEECRVSAEEAGRKVGGDGGARGGGASKRSYSVILREEREEAGGGRQELDWVVGGWEVKEAEPRSSWGEWLAGFLPSMPWGEATPPEVRATL